MHNKSIPYALLLEQRHNLASLAQTRIASAIPLARIWHDGTSVSTINDEIEAPSIPLIRHYLEWAHVPSVNGRVRSVPAHMFSQWSLPLLMRMLLNSESRLTNLVNLGGDIRVNAPIRPGEKLHLSADLVRVDDNAQRKSLSVRVITRNRRKQIAIDALLHCMVAKQALPDSSSARTSPARQWETAGAWAVDAQDGLRFALLTGDFNPIHWADSVARHSPFGQKVLHGFASLSLSWAALEARNGAGNGIQHITARFVRPVPLPSASMYVYRSAPRSSGMRRYELRNATGNMFLFGEYSTKSRMGSDSTAAPSDTIALA